jgi:steroid delta-isomerase-like uncharacterized protein
LLTGWLSTTPAGWSIRTTTSMLSALNEGSRIGAHPARGGSSVPEAENRELFQRYFDEVANAGDLDRADEFFAADYQHHDPANPDPRPVVGPDGVRAHLTSLREAFPDLMFAVDEMVTDGESIVVRWTVRGTNTGNYFGMPPTNKPIEITGMNTWTTRDGKAIEGWVNRDDLGLLQQLGVVPSPG